MEARVKQHLKQYPKNIPYIVGVSGGCDSMCLLDILYKEGYQVIVCHVNYRLRPKAETDRDYQIVSEYCKLRQIPFYYKEAKRCQKDNFQQSARHIRYDFYFEIGKIYHTNKVFLGHHKDDVYETILMQKKRGGEELYWGIKNESEVRGNQVYRIFLEVTKKEIIEYCHKYNIDYHDDYTNFETYYQRDYIRNVVLCKMSDQEKESLLIEAEEHNQTLRLKRERSKALLDMHLIDGLFYFKDLNEADLPEVIHRYLEIYLPDQRISRALIDEVYRALKNKRPNLKITLPVNLRFIKEYDNGYIQTSSQKADYEYHFTHFYEFECDYFMLTASGQLNEGIYLSKEDFPITIRNFRPGDIVHTKFGHKKVSRLFIDNKIPQVQRTTWPILVNKNGEILLIPHIVKNLRYMDTKANVFVVK